MNNNNFIAAIVLGSSKITGIVGSKEIDGSIKVKAHVAHPSSDFIGKGRVLNVEKMTSCLTSIKARLEEQVSCRIKSFYVSIGCMGLRSIMNDVAIQLSTSELVTDELLASIGVRNKEGKPSDRDILEAIPLEYRLGASGTQVTQDPKGMMTDRLQAKFLNLVCSSNAIATITACFRKANIEIADGKFCISAEQLASVITNEQERTSGCAFVDMGSETTTVAIYKGKVLRHLCVIPLGSASVTRDIANVFNVEIDEAENFKRTYGYPDFEEIDDKEEIHLRDGGRVKKLSELAEIIDARIEEIIQNVKRQIELSGYTHDNLVNGIYVCGGGAQMRGINSAFHSHFKDWNLRIVKNTTRLNVKASDSNFNESGIFNIGLAIIDNFETNCYGGDLISDLFTEPDPTEAEKAEQERQEAEKAAQEAAEKEAEERAAAEAAKKKGPNAFTSFLKRVKKFGADLVSENE